jgi:hypothetical protein
MLQFVVGGYHQAILEAGVHELANWLNFWHFSCQLMGRFHAPYEHFTYKLPMTPFLFYLFKIGIPFALHFHLCFHLCCDILDFANLSFPFF